MGINLKEMDVTLNVSEGEAVLSALEDKMDHMEPVGEEYEVLRSAHAEIRFAIRAAEGNR